MMLPSVFKSSRKFCISCWTQAKYDGNYCEECGNFLVPLNSVRTWCSTCKINNENGDGIACVQCGDLLQIPERNSPDSPTEESVLKESTALPTRRNSDTRSNSIPEPRGLPETNNSASFRSQSIMLKTSSGKIVGLNPPYIQDEMKDWNLFDRSCIQNGGVPEIGDEVEFETHRVTRKIKRVWLLKALDFTTSTPTINISNSQNQSSRYVTPIKESSTESSRSIYKLSPIEASSQPEIYPKEQKELGDDKRLSDQTRQYNSTSDSKQLQPSPLPRPRPKSTSTNFHQPVEVAHMSPVFPSKRIMPTPAERKSANNIIEDDKIVLLNGKPANHSRTVPSIYFSAEETKQTPFGHSTKSPTFYDKEDHKNSFNSTASPVKTETKLAPTGGARPSLMDLINTQIKQMEQPKESNSAVKNQSSGNKLDTEAVKKIEKDDEKYKDIKQLPQSQQQQQQFEENKEDNQQQQKQQQQQKENEENNQPNTTTTTTTTNNNNNNNNNNSSSNSNKKEIIIDNTATPNKSATTSTKQSPPKQENRRVTYSGWVMQFIANVKDGKNPFGFIQKYDEVDGERKELLSPTEDGKKNDIFFSFAAVLSNTLHLSRGDDVEFKLFPARKKGEKPKAGNVIVTKLSKREHSDLLEYLEDMLGNLTEKEFDSLELYGKPGEKVNIMKFIDSPTVWREVTHQVSSFTNDDNILEKLLLTLLVIQEHIKTLDEKFRQILLHVTASQKFFDPRKGRMKQYIMQHIDDYENSSIDMVQRFLLMVMRLVPEKRPVVIALVNPLMENPTGATARFLYKILKVMTSGATESVADLEWRELPLILKKEEIFNPDLDNWNNLSPVQATGSYSAADEYVDVYFRLLREDCFNTLKKCIKQLLDGTLDNRDMNVYTNVALAGYDLKSNALYLALRIKPVQEVKNWDTSSSLMFGNLLCISIGGNFQSPIWVTVADRELLKKNSIVVVQTCWEWNDMDDANIMLNLITSKGSIIMVESPTYYRAFQPILKTLQSLECDNISFAEELVTLASGKLPDFLNPNTDFAAEIVFKKPINKSRVTISEFLRTSHSANSVFDESQEEAVKTALQNRIGIIQGPPGCGKSFIGVQMLRLLLSLSNLNEPKVLVLTYKNHALDEFLKDIMKHVDHSDVIRIGGRCKDEELEKISLNSQKRAKRGADIITQINTLKDGSREIEDLIHEKFKDLNKLRTFDYNMLLEDLSEEQKHSLLLDCNWEITNISVNVGAIKDDDGFQKQRGKKKKTKVTKKVIEKLLEDVDGNQWAIWKLLIEALKLWMPHQNVFDDFESRLVGKKAVVINLNQVNKNKNGKKNKDGEKAVEVYELNDEQDIEDVQNERLSALTKSTFSVKGESRNSTLRQVNYTDDEEDDKAIRIKSFSSDALDKLMSTHAGILLAITDIWSMTDEDRVKFVQFHVAKSTEGIRSSFQELLKQYEDKSKEIMELENQHVANIIKGKKIIGATITGAAIHQQVLKEVEPEIVIVEEAAEVLEPQLLAAIGTWTKYMLLIGDHKQLRPPVECYELRRDFNFDISMMERLINNDMPYGTLTMQNRQRPEFAELLKDIYPNLQTNFARVQNNAPAKCFHKSSFFWHHVSPEKSDRSVTNSDEAERCVKLALFLVEQGYEPNTITILATYQGQTALIRKTLKEYEQKFPGLFRLQAVTQQTAKGQHQKGDTVKNTIKVHTVDMYQGDENDFVIVSLVRSNPNMKIGFLKLQNRRCVAQSRAKCGVYFVGNADMFINHPHWKFLIDKMKATNRLGDCMEIVCEHHPNNIIRVKDSNQLKLGSSFCRQPCTFTMSCQIHKCDRPCKPPHSHKPCPNLVQFQFKTCLHKGSRKCEEDESQMVCKETVKFIFPKCHHPGERQCCQDPATILCDYKVSVTLSCHHKANKLCYQNIDGIKCMEKCAKVRPCDHTCQDHLCHQHEGIKTCKKCEKIEEAKKEEQRKQEEKLRKENEAMVDKEIEKLRKEAVNQKGVIRTQLHPHGETASEYLDVEDLVKKYVQPGHKWYPKVKKIEKVTNYALRIKWLQSKKRLFDKDARMQLKFHGTSVEGVDGITKNGFLLPKNPGMYGCGIYLASDSSKSAQELYTKGSNMLLLCEALLGKSLTVNNARNSMTAKELQGLRCDSLFAQRGTRETGGVRYDEFVIYNPDQVFPKYIIHYECGKFKPEVTATVAFTQDFANGKKIIKSNRETDSNDPLEKAFSYVEARFLRMLQRRTGNEKCEITYIEYYTNPTLKMKFDRKHDEFKKKFGPKDKRSKPILGFHGTKDTSIVDSIMNNNFHKSVHGKFGAGVYFSEQPSYTFNYGGRNHLIMAQLLPGNTKECPNGWSAGGCTPGYDSHGGFKQPDGTFDEIVIFNSEQILPSYVIHFKASL